METADRQCVCVPDFEKRADRFPWNFSWFIGVIRRLGRIKHSGKCRPLMCKISENGEKLPILTKYAVENGTGSTALAARASRARLRWPVIWLRHGPIAIWETAWQRLRPPQARGATERLPGRPLSSDRSYIASPKWMALKIAGACVVWQQANFRQTTSRKLLKVTLPSTAITHCHSPL